MKKPVVDKELCIGCGACADACPEVFEVKDDEKAYVIAPEKCNTCDCESTVDICPVQAISMAE